MAGSISINQAAKIRNTDYDKTNASCAIISLLHCFMAVKFIRSFTIFTTCRRFRGKIEVNLNDTVKILYGPFMHKEGKVVQITNNTVKVELPTMGFALIAKVNKSHIFAS
ncbi:MAG: hypothetical protein QM763_11625 [Agriterribacter sp.]